MMVVMVVVVVVEITQVAVVIVVKSFPGYKYKLGARAGNTN